MRRTLSSAARSAMSLGLVVIIGSLLLAVVHKLTEARITDQEQRAVLQQLQQVLPPDRYDNALHTDYFHFSDETAFPQGQTVTAYRARKDGQPVAVILRFAAMDGYNGRINLLAGIDTTGQLTGVRVTSHKETPGLGDGIEVERSDWILAFTGKSLRHPLLERWAVRKDGGDFEQMTGATITPRAVVEAVRRALVYFGSHQEKLFDTPATEATMESS